MTYIPTVHSFNLWALAFLFAVVGVAQVPQDQPQLCGKSDVAVPLPEGVTFVGVDGGSSDLTLKLKNGSIKTVDLELPSSVPQVCPISRDRLLVFGTVAREDGPHVWIVSQLDGSILDHIGSRDPLVSPDQHWLAFRKFYPPRATVIAEEYLLYDLTKDPAENRTPGPEPSRPIREGRQIYPVTNKSHIPLAADDDLEPRHEFMSDSFFWSSDSKFLAFADWSAQTGTTSIVVANIGEKELTSYLRPVVESEVCGDGRARPASREMVHHIEFASTRGALPDVWVHPKAYACNKPMLLRGTDFKPAEIEVHKSLKRPGSIPQVR